MTRALHANGDKKDWYKKEKVLVTNERNGKKVVASILESGPAIWTNRVGGLSPEAFEAIDAALTGADVTGGQSGFEGCSPTFQFAGAIEGEIAWLKLLRIRIKTH